MTLEELKKYRLYCSEFNELSHKLKNSTSEESTLYRMKKLSEKIEAIERYVESIEDYKVYRAIKMYCIEPIGEGEKAPDWEEVACRIGNGCTESAIRKAVSRHFKKIEKISQNVTNVTHNFF